MIFGILISRQYTHKDIYMVYMTLQRKNFNALFITLGNSELLESVLSPGNVKYLSSIARAKHKMAVN